MSKEQFEELIQRAPQRKRPAHKLSFGARSFGGASKGLRSFGSSTKEEEGGHRNSEYRSKKGAHTRKRLSAIEGVHFSEKDALGAQRNGFRDRKLSRSKGLEKKRPHQKAFGSRSENRNESFERKERSRRSERDFEKMNQRSSSWKRSRKTMTEPSDSSSSAQTERSSSSKRPFFPTFRGFYSSKKSSKKKVAKANTSSLDSNRLDPLDVERNSVTLQHSVFVATAARKLAERLKGIDPDQAFVAGLYHDFGKFYLPRGWVYKHPKLGYELLRKLKKDKPWLANVCLAHPFPVLDNEAYFDFFCRGDTEEAQALKRLLKPLKANIPSLDAPLDLANAEGIILRLVQLCDKLSGVDRYVTLEEKFSWYEQWVSRSSDVKEVEEGRGVEIGLEAQTRAINYDAWRTIKSQIEALIGEEIYAVLGIVPAADIVS